MKPSLLLLLVPVASAASFISSEIEIGDARKKLIKQLEQELKENHLPGCKTDNPPDWCDDLLLYLKEVGSVEAKYLEGYKNFGEEYQQKIAKIGSGSAFAGMGQMMDRLGEVNISWNGPFARALWLRSMHWMNFDSVSCGKLFEKSVQKEGSLFLKDAIDYRHGSIDSLFDDYVAQYGLTQFPNLPSNVREAFEALETGKDKNRVLEFIAPLMSDHPKDHFRLRFGIMLSNSISVIRCQLTCLLHLIPKSDIMTRLEPRYLLDRWPTPIPYVVPRLETLLQLEDFCVKHDLDFGTWMAKHARSATRTLYQLHKHIGPANDAQIDQAFNIFKWDGEAAFDYDDPNKGTRADLIALVHSRWPQNLAPFMARIDVEMKLELMQKYPVCLAGMTLPTNPMPSIYRMLYYPKFYSHPPSDEYLKRLIEIYTFQKLLDMMKEDNATAGPHPHYTDTFIKRMELLSELVSLG